MITVNPQAIPTTYGPYVSQNRQVFYGNYTSAQFAPPPVVLDGYASSWAQNGNYTWMIGGGMLLGRITSAVTPNSSVGNYANSIIGLTSAAYSSGGTSLQTDIGTVAEIVRRIGTSGTISVTGPATAGGSLTSQTLVAVTFSNVNTTTGVITISSPGVSFVSGSLIGPTDGSQNVQYILGESEGIAVIDQYFNRINAQMTKMVTGGGTINTGILINYPSDASLKTYVKAQLAIYAPSLTFLDTILPQ